MENYKVFVKKSFEAVVQDLNYDETVIREYFSDLYIQHVDGNVLDCEQFCRHMQIQKQAVNAISIDFKHLHKMGIPYFQTTWSLSKQNKAARPSSR